MIVFRCQQLRVNEIALEIINNHSQVFVLRVSATFRFWILLFRYNFD